MPLNLPSRLPAVEILKSENIFVMDSQQALKIYGLCVLSY